MAPSGALLICKKEGLPLQTFLGILLGGGILTFLQFLIQRHDKKHDRFAAITKELEAIRAEIEKIDSKGDVRDAENRRVRILRFEDELQENRKHSKDSFDQVLSDITAYNKYCDAHPEFKNDQTVATVTHIKAVYNERLEKRDFL